MVVVSIVMDSLARVRTNFLLKVYEDQHLKPSHFTLVVAEFGRARLRPSLRRRLGRSLALPEPVRTGGVLDAGRRNSW
jgi:hypothetical protein